jgi:hypothetical protein
VPRSGFTGTMINSTNNLIRIDKTIHKTISAFYSRTVPGTGMAVRDTLNGLPFQEQHDYGMSIVEKAINGTF